MARLQDDGLHSMCKSNQEPQETSLLLILDAKITKMETFLISLKQVIDETLRLGGIAIWLMREAKEDVSYQGM